MPTKRDFGVHIQETKSFNEFYSRVVQEFGILDNEQNKKKLNTLRINFLTRWKKSHRSKRFLEQSYSLWLDESVVFSNAGDVPTTSSGKRGRPKKSFSEAKGRTQKKILKGEADKVTTPLSVKVLSTRLRRKGNRAGSSAVKLFGSASPRSSKKLYGKLKREEKVVQPYTPEEALSLLIEAKLSKKTYNVIRTDSKRKGADIFPSYDKLLSAKLQAYPKNIFTSESSCEVPLQDLLNHTASRILQTLKNDVEGKLNLICKWGFDGSSGHSLYKQGWEEDGSSDESVFVSSLVPLKLEGEVGTVWDNPRPSSTRFCRPIRLQFKKEKKNVIKGEESHIKNQIKTLKPLEIEGAEVEYRLQLTMINGKALCALTDTGTLQCPLCKQTAKSSTSWTQSKPINEAALEYGISPLHAYIRFLEFVLAVSYRLDTKTKASGDKKVPEVQKRKELVLGKIKENMHLNPDRPKQGYGSTTDGNTARRFFADPVAASNATGICPDVITRFSSILFVLSSGKNVHIEKFEEYCSETLSLYNEKYGWYSMTPTVHKVLVHGTILLKNSILPLGHLSEEAQESRNKDIRNFRQFFSRKASRRMNIEDLFCRLLLSSDPVISSARNLPKKNIRKVSKHVIEHVKGLLILDEEEDNDTEVEKEVDSNDETTTDDSEF